MQLRKKTSKESSAGKEKATTGSQTEGDLEQHERFPDIFYPPTATVCTDAFSAFLGDYHANLVFFFFVIHLVSRADEQRVRAAKALISVARSDDERTRYEKSAADDSVVLRELQKHNVVLSQTLTNGAVNSFQRYFSGIIQSAAQRRPELLSSSQTIRVDDVLRFSRHRDLVAFIIDRKVNDLSYGGLSEMERYFDDRLGVQMFEDNCQRALLRLFVEARNINVHNGGVVNELFVSRVGKVDGFTYTKGKRFHIDLDGLVTLCENAMRVAMNIDSVVAHKFHLKRKRHSAWRKQSSRNK